MRMYQVILCSIVRDSLRLDKVVKHVDTGVAERGEFEVVFDVHDRWVCRT
jgi:hypothetical protein